MSNIPLTETHLYTCTICGDPAYHEEQGYHVCSKECRVELRDNLRELAQMR